MYYDSLPEWAEIYRKANERGYENLDPLEKFLYDYTPGDGSEDNFREMLQEAMYFCHGQPSKIV